jgi:hypothetical protein
MRLPFHIPRLKLLTAVQPHRNMAEKLAVGKGTRGGGSSGKAGGSRGDNQEEDGEEQQGLEEDGPSADDLMMDQDDGGEGRGHADVGGDASDGENLGEVSGKGGKGSLGGTSAAARKAAKAGGGGGHKGAKPLAKRAKA